MRDQVGDRRLGGRLRRRPPRAAAVPGAVRVRLGRRPSLDGPQRSAWARRSFAPRGLQRVTVVGRALTVVPRCADVACDSSLERDGRVDCCSDWCDPDRRAVTETGPTSRARTLRDRVPPKSGLVAAGDSRALATGASGVEPQRRAGDRVMRQLVDVDSSSVVVVRRLRPRPARPRQPAAEHDRRRRRHGRPRVGPGVPARPPPAARPADGLDTRLVRRLPRVPVLHGAPGAADRGAQRRAPRLGGADPRGRARSSSAVARGGRRRDRLRRHVAGRHRRRRSPCSCIGMPYDVAFKLVTVLGVLSLPVAAYAFGRLADLPFPTPALFAIATLLFLFNREPTLTRHRQHHRRQPHVDAGRRVQLLDQPHVRRAVPRHDRRRVPHRPVPWLAAVLLALTALCHLIVAIFVLDRGRARVRRVAGQGAAQVAGCVAAGRRAARPRSGRCRSSPAART